MSSTVTIQPSGHVLTVATTETILEAALRAGLALDYGCTNGSCGKCKARVTGGDVRELHFHDYVLSAVERQAGFCLLCCVAPQGDGVSIYAEQARIGEIPIQSITARVHKLESFGAGLAVLSLRTPRSQVLRFLPGQQLILKREGIGAARVPIASCPCDGMHLRFHLRYQPGDAFSEWVFRHSKRADSVHIEGPWGRFSLDEESTRPIIFVANDVGFGAASSLIEHALNIDLPQSMHLYWYAARPEGHYLDNQCRAWADALDAFSYTPLVAAAGNAPAGDGATGANVLSDAPRVSGKVGRAIVENYPDLSTFDCYLIGPRAFRAAAKRPLLAHGLPQQRLFEQDITAE
ncbi:MAG: 2Fe-2S iron-sulfur cluster-binding protein [Gammaproteobacteria bacterium]